MATVSSPFKGRIHRLLDEYLSGKGEHLSRDIDGITKTVVVGAEMGRDQHWRVKKKKEFKGILLKMVFVSSNAKIIIVS